MGYVFVQREIRNKFGRKVGGSEWEVSVCTDQGMTAAAAVKLDSAGSFARPNDVPGGASPGYANSGWQYLLTATLAPAGTTLTLESTTNIVVGDRFQVVEGTFRVWLTVKTIVNGTQITVVAAPNASGDSSGHTYTTAATAGDPDNLGDWAGWISDAADVWAAVKKVGTTAWSAPKQWHITVPAAVTDATISVSDVTTNDVSITKHGWAPKAPNDSTKFLDGTGGWSVPASGTVIVITLAETSSNFTTSSTSMVDITGLSISITPSNAGNKVEIEAYFVDVSCDTAAAPVTTRLYDSTSSVEIQVAANLSQDTGDRTPTMIKRITTFAASVRTIKAQGKTGAGTATWRAVWTAGTGDNMWIAAKEYR